MLPSNPWFWISVIAIVLFYVYILKKIAEAKEENFAEFRRILREHPNWKMTKFKWIEAIGWVTMVIGFVTLAFSIINLFSRESLFITLFGSCFVIGGYLVATHYRRLRPTAQEKVKKLEKQNT